MKQKKNGNVTPKTWISTQQADSKKITFLLFTSALSCRWMFECIDFSSVLLGLKLLLGSFAKIGVLCVLACIRYYCGCCLSIHQSVSPSPHFSTSSLEVLRYLHWGHWQKLQPLRCHNVPHSDCACLQLVLLSSQLLWHWVSNQRVKRFHSDIKIYEPNEYKVCIFDSTHFMIKSK